jgi:hypothetical protein
MSAAAGSGGGASGGGGSTEPAGLQLELVEVDNPEELNFILGGWWQPEVVGLGCLTPPFAPARICFSAGHPLASPPAQLLLMPCRFMLRMAAGQAHFIKTVEDLGESLFQSGTAIKFGLAFCEASGERKIR